MRKEIVLGVVAALAIAIAAAPARAVTLPGSLYEGSVEDASSLFENVGDQDNDGNTDWEPIVAGSAVERGQEQRTVFVVDALEFQGLLVPSAEPFGTLEIDASTNLPGYQSKFFSGMLYDVVVNRVVFTDDDGDGVQDVGEALKLEFGIGARYTNAGGVDGTWTDLYPGTGGLLATTAAGYGGLLVVYADDPVANQPALSGDGGFPGGDGDGFGGATPLDGQYDWREPGDASGTSPHPGPNPVPDGSLTMTDYFPSIADILGTAGPGDSGSAKVALVAVLAPLNGTAVEATYGPFGGPTVLYEQILIGGKGFGITFANVIGGYLAPLMQTDIFGPGWDIRLDFETAGGFTLNTESWQIKSDDPVQFGTIPEPASLTLLGLSLVGLMGAKLRKKQ